MGIRDSRNLVKTPRWGVTTGETLSGNAAEPPSGQKDAGWQPGIDVPVGEWWNWLHQQAGLFLEYLEGVAGQRWTINHLPRSQKVLGAGEVTNGVGMSVDVAKGLYWIQGAQYEISAASNLALAPADPTDPRYDLVVAQVVAGVPSYKAITGTPDPSPVEPSPSANQLALYRVRVNAAAATPSTKTDRRNFGVISLDRIESSVRLVAGDIGGGNYLLDVNTDSGNTVSIGQAGLTTIGGTVLQIIADTVMQVLPGAVQFTAPIVRKLDFPMFAFTHRSDVDEQTIGGGQALVDTGGVPNVRAPVQIPNGATITAFRLYGYRATNTPGFTAILTAYGKGTGVGVVIGTIASNAGSGASGNFTRAETGLSYAVDQSHSYELQIVWVASSNDLGLRGAEVEWEESTPWKTI